LPSSISRNGPVSTTQFRRREHNLAGWDIMAGHDPIKLLDTKAKHNFGSAGIIGLPNRLAPSLYLAHDKRRHAERNCRTDHDGEYKKVQVLQ
jgi:hypothetical protein